jgi:hypothetical protein
MLTVAVHQVRLYSIAKTGTIKTGKRLRIERYHGIWLKKAGKDLKFFNNYLDKTIN